MMALTKAHNRMIAGAVVNVKDFGAVGDGVADDTTAIQAAIDYCKSQLTATLNSTNGGLASLYFPQGMYIVSSSLNVSAVVGFRMFGDGRRTTQIVFTGSNSHLFSYSNYIYCTIDDLTFMTGTVSVVGGLPQVAAPGTKNNTCFKFNGTGGGTGTNFENCEFLYWEKVFTTTDSTVNDDGHNHQECNFFYNKIVWDNTNTQAVLWTFLDCKVFYNEDTVFKNPAANLYVRGGDFINPGDFLTATLTSSGLDSIFSDVRFENYQNIDPTSAPQILVLSGSHNGLIFDRCSARGGGSLAGKTAATLSGQFEITMRDCQNLSGTWEITANSSSDSTLSLLTLENTELTINQTVSPTQGNRPVNVNCINYPSSLFGRVDRYFRGASGGQTKPISAAPMVDAITFQSAINASTVSRAVPVFVLAPYSMVLSKIEFVVTNNSVVTFDILVWQDSTKTTKLCEITGMNANGVTKVFKADATVWPQFTSTSDPIFIEVTSAGNAGTVSGQISLEFVQTY